MVQLVYTLCALTSVACAWLLLSRYRATGLRLLLWSGLCFVGLSLNNAVMLADMLVGPTVDLSLLRTIVALAAMTILMVGLVGEIR
jgi:hypothetical protein